MRPAPRAFTLIELPAVRQRGFTLIELLVVVTVIVVLIAMLAPSLDKAIDAAVKARCGAQQHALIHLMISYASDHRQKYMPGTRGARTAEGTPITGVYDDYDEHIPYLNATYIAMIEKYSGNSNKMNTYVNGYQYGGLPPVLIDPTYPVTFGILDGAYGTWMGYNYLAGHPYVDKANGTRPGVPDWKSPTSLGRPGSGQMWVCHNTWEVGGRLANIAHTKPGGPAGGGDFFNWGNGGKRPEQFESAGGNIGRVDGSSTWKDLEDMNEYASGANKDGAGYWGWPAMW